MYIDMSQNNAFKSCYFLRVILIALDIYFNNENGFHVQWWETWKTNIAFSKWTSIVTYHEWNWLETNFLSWALFLGIFMVFFFLFNIVQLSNQCESFLSRLLQMLRQTILILFRLFLVKFDFSVYKQNIASISLTASRYNTFFMKSV